MNQKNTQLKHSEITEPIYSCELLLSCLAKEIAKEIAKEYVKCLENNRLIEQRNNLEETE